MKLNKKQLKYLFYILNSYEIDEDKPTKEYNNEATMINNLLEIIKAEYINNKE